jgi:hypothetical protein
MAREIRDANGKLIGTVRSTHPILNALAALFGVILVIYAVSGTGPVMWVAFALITVVMVGRKLRRDAARER